LVWNFFTAKTAIVRRFFARPLTAIYISDMNSVPGFPK
jgi:hypothetical protein